MHLDHCKWSITSLYEGVLTECSLTYFYNYIKNLFAAKTKQQHLDEYENLQTRQEVLRIESREIQGHMSKLANKIEQQRQQQQNIEREEKKVRDKIQSLKEKLVELESHKKGYDREIDDIEMERTKDKNKLNMVQDTLSSIELEMEKVSLSVVRHTIYLLFAGYIICFWCDKCCKKHDIVVAFVRSL